MFNENGVSKYVAVLLKYNQVAQISVGNEIFYWIGSHFKVLMPLTKRMKHCVCLSKIWKKEAQKESSPQYERIWELLWWIIT